MNILIFDLDGTLVDSFEDIADAVNLMLKELNIPERAYSDLYSYIGIGLEYLIKKSTSNIDKDYCDKALKIFRKYYNKNITNKSRPYPYVIELLGSIYKDNSLFVLTNKNKDFALVMLKQLNLIKYFKKVYGPPDIKQLKPHPSSIIDILNEYGYKKDNVYMIGDNYTDIEAGKNAGVRTVFCKYGRGKSSKIVKPDYIISSMKELINIIQ